ncbi:MAG: enoyl-CoA hydratase/isomerase family protein [Alphaproteobacteria bacterium]
MSTEPDSIRYSTKADIAVIEIDNPPLNALAQPIWDGLERAFARAFGDMAVHAIVLAGAGRVFSAGADIREFEKPVDQLMQPFALNAIERGAKPIVASLHGVALGGGLELAVGCHFRVAAPGTRLGHPEVTLGLLPGAGGTQRLPRLIGVVPALELITSGRLLDAEAALKIGLVDAVIGGTSAVETGIAFARGILAEHRTIRRACDMVQHISDRSAGHAAIARFRATLPESTPIRAAQENCLAAVAAALELPLEAGLQRERALFIACMATPEHDQLRRAFLSKRTEAKT